MRIPLHTATVAPALGDPIEPRTNIVGVQVSALGDGAVTATVQLKGRIDALAALQNIGDPISLSGNATPSAPVSSMVTKTDLAVAELYADLTAVSAISFRAVAWEAR